MSQGDRGVLEMRLLDVVLVVSLASLVSCGDRAGGRTGSQSAEPRSLLELEREGVDLSQREPLFAKSPLRAEPISHEFGSISIDGGTVETVFRVANEGEIPTRLVSVTTSCGCTTAVVEFDDGSSAGPFGMPGHGLSTAIDRVLDAGEVFRVRVNFDPAAHGRDGLGEISRGVTLETEGGGRTQVIIAATVVRE